MPEPRGQVGVIIRGCPDPEGATLSNPVLWSTYPFSSITGATGNLATAVVRARLEDSEHGVDGFVSQVSLQEPISAGGNLKLRLKDRPKTATRRDLCQLFAPDPAMTSTRYWVIKTLSSPELPKGVGAPPLSTFDLQGPAVAVGEILWIENEAVKVTASAAKHIGALYAVTVQRGVLGSRNREHAINPAGYVPGSDGSEACLVATDRPDFDRYSFEVELYHFQQEGTTAAVILEVFNRFTDGRPVPDETFYVVNTKDFGKGLQQVKSKGRTETKVSFAIQLLGRGIHGGTIGGSGDQFQNFADGFSAGLSGIGGPSLPQHIRIWCKIYEAERILNRRFRMPLSTTVNLPALTAYKGRVLTYAPTKLKPDLKVNCGGYDWTFRITDFAYATGPDWNTALGQEYIYIDASLLEHIQENGQAGSVKDSPVPGYQDTHGLTGGHFISPGSLQLALSEILGDEQADVARPGKFNQGWSENPQDRIRVEQGEKAPTVVARFWLEKVRPVEAALTFLLSEHGGGQNDATYDIIPGQLCAGLDSAMLALGAAAVTPVTIDPRTKKMLELDQLLNQVESIPIEVDKFDLGAELKRICLLNCLMSFQDTTGWGMRQIGGPVQGAGTTSIKQVTGKGRLVHQSNRLPSVNALILQGGYHPITLKPAWQQPLYLFDHNADELTIGQPVRTWQPGANSTAEQFFTGAVGALVRVSFMMQQGSPPVYKVPTKRLRGRVDVGDLCSWVDDSIPAPNGRGTTQGNGRWVCVGRDVVFHAADQFVYLMVDSVNDVTQSNRAIGQAWLIDRVGQDSTGQWCIVIKPLVYKADGTGDIDLDDVIGQMTGDTTAYLRLVTEDAHDGVGDPDRPGFLEFYGSVVNVTDTDRTGLDAILVITLSIDSSWLRSGLTPANLAEGASYAMLCDYRPAETNLEGNDILPVYALSYAMVAPGDGNPKSNRPYGSSLTTIDT